MRKVRWFLFALLWPWLTACVHAPAPVPSPTKCTKDVYDEFVDRTIESDVLNNKDDARAVREFVIEDLEETNNCTFH